jgi:hypothetical protein
VTAIFLDMVGARAERTIFDVTWQIIDAFAHRASGRIRRPVASYFASCNCLVSMLSAGVPATASSITLPPQLRRLQIHTCNWFVDHTWMRCRDSGTGFDMGEDRI